MTSVLVQSGLYKPGLTRRQVVQQFEADVFFDLVYVELVKRIQSQMGEVSYDAARIEVDGKFALMRPKSKDEIRLERANRIRNNVRALGKALGS